MHSIPLMIGACCALCALMRSHNCTIHENCPSVGRARSAGTTVSVSDEAGEDILKGDMVGKGFAGIVLNCARVWMSVPV